MSERKIGAPGPGWRMPGRAKSASIRDSMPHLLNSMGDSIERANKMDFGSPGIHTQNGFQQQFKQEVQGPLWVLLTEDLAAGTYDTPSSAYGNILLPDNSISENSLKESPQELQIWNYSSSLTANSGDWVMVIPFNRVFVTVPSGGGVGNEWIKFDVFQLCPSVGGGATQAVWARITRTSCQSSVSVGDIVLVWDTDGCWFNVPAELLATMSGKADLTAGQGETFLFCAVYYDLGECYWNVSGLCCYEESY